MTIPEIAIIGHPNEGKSSVLSTLAEDDSVRISPIPGETTVCRTFPVLIDGQEVLRFIDTPGFQNPGRMLSHLKQSSGSNAEKIRSLLKLTESMAELQEDHELLQPIARGAGLIYVVDGSRPLRSVDRMEMEILRLLGKPRMAVINSKQQTDRYVSQWQDELAKHFNISRRFNAHRATYAERIDLLEALRAIEQGWQDVLSEVVQAFKLDWQRRTDTVALILIGLLRQCLGHRLIRELHENQGEEQLKHSLVQQFSGDIENWEKLAHQQMRSLFKHNIFNYELPPHSILYEGLFSEKSWQLLGLTRKQTIILGSLGGAALGATLDIGALGHGLGMFTLVGSAVGGLGAVLSSKQLTSRASVLGMTLAGPHVQVGPPQDITLLFVLINRALLYYQHIINWAHGRRDYDTEPGGDPYSDLEQFTRGWPAEHLRVCRRFFQEATSESRDTLQKVEQELLEVLIDSLKSISQADIHQQK